MNCAIHLLLDKTCKILESLLLRLKLRLIQLKPSRKQVKDVGTYFAGNVDWKKYETKQL